MNKKTVAIILEIIPILAAIAAITLMISSFDSGVVRSAILASVILSFLGFLFFIVARKLSKDKVVLILGIFDILATFSIVGFYVLAIFVFGL